MFNIESEKIWNSISRSKNNYDYAKRLIPIKTTRDISLGYRFSDMSLSIFLDIPTKTLPKKIPKGDGFKIKYLNIRGSKHLSRLVILLTEKNIEKLFKVTDILINELDGIKEDKKIVEKVFSELFALQDFFKQLETSKGMSENLQQGLFTELDFLENELFKNLPYRKL